MNEERTYQQLYRDAIPSVVSIYVRPADAGRPSPSAGSGFVHDEAGHVVTNHHVVGGTDEVELRFSDGDWRTGTVVGSDAYTDLAVVRVDDLPAAAGPLPVAATNPEPGVRVAALGNPMGLDGTVTAGIVSGVNRSMLTGNGFAIPDTVQTDAAINPGNSGGPLVALDAADDAPRETDDGTDAPHASEDGSDARPVVVGVNRAKQGDNIGFAISPEIVHRVVPELIETGACHHAYLKIRTVDVSPRVAEANGLAEPRGVLVVDVSLGPASGALVGCEESRTVRGREVPVGGDVIVGIDGREIRSHEELMRYLITETRPGEPITVDVIRDGRRLTEHLTLGERPRPGGSRIPVQ